VDVRIRGREWECVEVKREFGESSLRLRLAEAETALAWEDRFGILRYWR
jgi:hypothetical protein